ncbi:hypothetical protein AVEN_140404-1 [Araneus ventricosus]|uniref:Uncharacterized protein n=1 Tax=Araneus ventricosus TaxID=182803 RepID=A0A4Y2T5T4_ARAVE|nr:hypothetical protein AVEN_134316-1 [Araneus ventricosus]GBN96270.1 hypothetical protein AVEN_140404-1 [Araneus ventricosus]
MPGHCSSDSRLDAKFQMEGVILSPSPDLDLSDCFLFLQMKQYLSGTKFSSDDDETKMWLNEYRRDFYQVGMNKLVLWSDKCLNGFGDFAER